MDDVTNALIKILKKPPKGKIPHSIFNVGGSKPKHLKLFLKIFNIIVWLSSSELCPVAILSAFNSLANLFKSALLKVPQILQGLIFLFFSFKILTFSSWIVLKFFLFH